MGTVNRFVEMSLEDLRQELWLAARRIRARPRRTQAGDDIADLLDAACKRLEPPAAPLPDGRYPPPVTI